MDCFWLQRRYLQTCIPPKSKPRRKFGYIFVREWANILKIDHLEIPSPKRVLDAGTARSVSLVIFCIATLITKLKYSTITKNSSSATFTFFSFFFYVLNVSSCPRFQVTLVNWATGTSANRRRRNGSKERWTERWLSTSRRVTATLLAWPSTMRLTRGAVAILDDSVSQDDPVLL